MKSRVLAVLVLAIAVLVTACDALFPVAVDPCPLPAAKHPEAWSATPTVTAAGDTVAWTYICTGPGVVTH